MTTTQLEVTYVILYRKKDRYREENLRHIMRWLPERLAKFKYEILVCEQDSESKYVTDPELDPTTVRHVFQYNPQVFNRGWGFNCGIKHNCNPSTKVVVIGDGDLLTLQPHALEDAIQLCLDDKYDVVSPYTQVYKTDEESRKELMNDEIIGLNALTRQNCGSYYTTAGGLMVIKRELFLKMGGFEEYEGWGLEDRAFDVSLERYTTSDRVKQLPYLAIHLYHPINPDRRALGIFGDRMKKHAEVYGCPTSEYTQSYLRGDHSKTGHLDSPHRYCQHSLEKGRVITPVLRRFNVDKYRRLVIVLGNMRKVRSKYSREDVMIVDPVNNFREYHRPKYYIITEGSYAEYTISRSAVQIYVPGMDKTHPLYENLKIGKAKLQHAAMLAKRLGYEEVVLNGRLRENGLNN